MSYDTMSNLSAATSSVNHMQNAQNQQYYQIEIKQGFSNSIVCNNQQPKTEDQVIEQYKQERNLRFGIDDTTVITRENNSTIIIDSASAAGLGECIAHIICCFAQCFQ
ncbi:Hypothetical_protein [Hexamita inflata]|uniref:Hypothetical_protein n=1 Tax=Hexamita inflata TaxID=28002 RepID=A0AA86RBR5_9EUKA|nr:Hypothetical protein HINF_LOCUS57727 [Hexamita inflata]